MPTEITEYKTKLYSYLVRRLSSLQIERGTFESHWKDLSQFIQPRRGRFFVSDRNKGERRHNVIINSAGTQALRSATAGLLSGTMSPSRPWFSLEVNNMELMDNQNVRVWLHDVEDQMRSVFNQSNLYNMAPVMLSELLLFGTGCMLHEDDSQDIARFYALTAGSYYLGQNDRFEIDTLVRRFQLPASAIVEKFGIDNVSTQVRTSYERGNYDNWFTIVHVIEPRKERSPDNPFSSNMPFRSVYFEFGDESVTSYSSDSSSGGAGAENILFEGGFETFPAYCPRWGVTVEDVYGTDCPGMVALGDVKQLQERRKAQAIDKLVNPPLQGPSSLKDKPISSLPGGITLVETGPEGRNGITSLYDVNPQVMELVQDIDKTERRIQDSFYLDLFFAITNMEGIQPKNQLELAQRNEERLLQLGPVLEQLHGEFLDKLIDRTFRG